MLRATGQRGRLKVIAAVAGAYLVGTGGAVALTRYDGGVACIWIANAVLIAALTEFRRRHWPALVSACVVASTVATGAWGIGWHFAPLLATINVAEAVIAASLLRVWSVSGSGLNSPRDFLLFVLASGILAPLVSGVAGAAVVSHVTGTDFLLNGSRWFVAHALGAIGFTPVIVLAGTGEVRRFRQHAGRKGIIEACLILALLVAISVAVFAQARLPMLFVPILPLMLATFRLGRLGAPAAVMIMATIGGVLTLAGYGPVYLIQGSTAEHMQFFQLYLAATILTVLPVAADLARRATLFERLRDSEARFRLLTEQSSDIVMNLNVAGVIRYVSPSVSRLGGYDPAALLGTASINLVADEDRERVRDVHRRALQRPGETFAVEYRAITASGEWLWFETQTSAVTDEDGNVTGVVSAARETSARKQAEVDLAHAAHTDALTGVSNRRAFDRELQNVARDCGGCVAIVDLDHFKRINDTFGHSVGDDVLRAFGCAAQAQVRSGDMLARIGGEEFGIIFPRLPINIAETVSERIRHVVSELEVRAGDWPVRVTASIGIAAFGPGDNPAEVLKRADEALYRAKDAGRNRLSTAA